MVKSSLKTGPCDIPLSVWSSIAKMAAKAKDRGWISYDELKAALPDDKINLEQIEYTMSHFSELGIRIVEHDERHERTANVQEWGPTRPVRNLDLIIAGKCVRIAKLRYTQEIYWLVREGGALAARLLNRVARDAALETHIGMLPGSEVSLLNHDEAELCMLFEKQGKKVDHRSTNDHLLFVTDASNWWSEMALTEGFDPALLSSEIEIHILPDGEERALLIPIYKGRRLSFGCPPASDYPIEWEESNSLFVVAEGRVERTDLGRSSLCADPIFDFGDSPTKAFRRALQSLFMELAVHGVYGVDYGRDGLVMREIWSEIDVPLSFYIENGLDPYSDVPIVAVDTITEARDLSEASKYTVVSWEDLHQLHNRVSHPELTLSADITCESMFFISRSDERAEYAILLCQELAPKHGLHVTWAGNIDIAATVSLLVET